MKMHAQEAYDVEDHNTNITRVQVRIHNVGHAMRVFAESTYSRPIEAVVRETIANAIDASKGGMFFITPPSLLNPNFVVRDHGVGMTEAFFCDGYAAVGFSTKRDSNDEIGGFGQGRFAAFAYQGCDIFYVRGFKDGRMFRGSVSRNSDFEIFCQIEERGNTTEDDGVEITIPVKIVDHAKFIEAIKIYTEFVDNADIPFERIQRPTLMEGKDWRLSSLNHSEDFLGSRCRAVMGGVPYNLDLSDCKWHYDDIGRFATNFNYADFHFPIGALAVSASRESLRYDDATQAAIKTLFLQIRDEIAGKQAKLELTCKTDWEKKTNPEIIALRRLFSRGFSSLDLRPILGIELARNLNRSEKWGGTRRHRLQQIEFSPGHTFHIFVKDECVAWRSRFNFREEELRDNSMHQSKEYVIVVNNLEAIVKMGDPPYTLISTLPRPPTVPRQPRSISTGPRVVGPRFYHTKDGLVPADYSKPGVYVPYKITLIDEEWVSLYQVWPLAEPPIGVPAADIKTAEAAGWVRFDEHLRKTVTPEVLRAYGISRQCESLNHGNTNRTLHELIELKWKSGKVFVEKLLEYYGVLRKPDNAKWFPALGLLKIEPGKVNVNLDAIYEHVKRRHPSFTVLISTNALYYVHPGHTREEKLLLAAKSL